MSSMRSTRCNLSAIQDASSIASPSASVMSARLQPGPGARGSVAARRRAAAASGGPSPPTRGRGTCFPRSALLQQHTKASCQRARGPGLPAAADVDAVAGELPLLFRRRHVAGRPRVCGERNVHVCVAGPAAHNLSHTEDRGTCLPHPVEGQR